jgi:endoplasmic reticulum-Golgi intermediate compartment protein 3
MAARSRFHKLDAFTKTVEDARVRTTSGGIVTIASILLIFYLVWGEWSEYRKILVMPELIVDKGRGEIWLSCNSAPRLNHWMEGWWKRSEHN